MIGASGSTQTIWFGISLVGIDGQIFDAGSYDQQFTIQHNITRHLLVLLFKVIPRQTLFYKIQVMANLAFLQQDMFFGIGTQLQ